MHYQGSADLHPGETQPSRNPRYFNGLTQDQVDLIELHMQNDNNKCSKGVNTDDVVIFSSEADVTKAISSSTKTTKTMSTQTPCHWINNDSVNNKLDMILTLLQKQTSCNLQHSNDLMQILIDEGNIIQPDPPASQPTSPPEDHFDLETSRYNLPDFLEMSPPCSTKTNSPPLSVSQPVTFQPPVLTTKPKTVPVQLNQNIPSAQIQQNDHMPVRSIPYSATSSSITNNASEQPINAPAVIISTTQLNSTQKHRNLCSTSYQSAWETSCSRYNSN